jgi:RNA polymerase sigma-70 factor (ECF subfamily)
MSDFHTSTELLGGLFETNRAEAWELFDQRYRPIVEGVARRMGLNANEAAEVAQEAITRFVIAYREGRYKREKGRLRDWLLGIARHVMRESARRWAKAPTPAGGRSMADWVFDEHSLERAWLPSRAAAVLNHAIEMLRVETRGTPESMRAFELVAFQGVPPAQVAEDMGLTRNHVYVIKHRLTSRLRVLVERLDGLYDDEAAA